MNNRGATLGLGGCRSELARDGRGEIACEQAPTSLTRRLRRYRERLRFNCMIRGNIGRRRSEGPGWSACRGFTLLELLLSLALVGLLLVAMNQFIFSMGELWGRGADVRLFDQHVRAVTRFVEETLHSTALPAASGAQASFADLSATKQTLDLWSGRLTSTFVFDGQPVEVRGGGPDQNLILLDDAIVYNASHLFGFFSVNLF